MDIHGYPWISTQNRPGYGYGYGCDYSSPRQAWIFVHPAENSGSPRLNLSSFKRA